MSQELVQKVKDYLASQGQTFDSPCGAYSITEHVARVLRAGVLSKPAGNGCDGKAVDQVCWPDGTIRDVLEDAGGASIPRWGEPEQVDPSRYIAVPPWDLPSEPSPEPVPQPVPSTPPDLAPILARLDALEAESKSLRTLAEAIADQFGTGVRAVLAKMVIRGNTNRIWGHAHQVDLKIEEV